MSPPRRLLSRLNVPAPRHMAKKKSFRSAPRIVSGRDSDRWILLMRLASAMFSSFWDQRVSSTRKEPGQEVHGCDGHPDAEQHSGQNALRPAFTEGEGEAGHDDRDKRESARNGACKRRLKDVDGALPGGIARLSESGSCEEKSQGDGDHRIALPRRTEELASNSFHLWVLPFSHVMEIKR